jgi:hypothetical protein
MGALVLDTPVPEELLESLKKSSEISNITQVS